ncbi:hypothetical protein TNCV_4212421 [Trichonephila clavipes]|nr:hypothetical protein TNCV_4212421 [Trichonephila clavipes]
MLYKIPFLTVKGGRKIRDDDEDIHYNRAWKEVKFTHKSTKYKERSTRGSMKDVGDTTNVGALVLPKNFYWNVNHFEIFLLPFRKQGHLNHHLPYILSPEKES